MIKTRLIKLVPDSKKYILQNIFWQWLALIFNIAAITSIGMLLQSVFFGDADSKKIMMTAAVICCAVIVRFVCDRRAAATSFFAGEKVKEVLREQIYKKMLRLGAGYRNQISTSEVVQVATEGAEQLEIYFGKYLPQLFYSLLAPLTLFACLSWISLKASLVLLVCVPLIPLSIVAVQKFAKKLLSKYWGIYTELGDSFLENLQGLTTLKIYKADEKKAEAMDKEAEHFRKITMKVLTMQLNSISVMDLVAYGGAAVGMAVIVREYLSGAVGFVGTFTIILLAADFFIPLRLLGSFFHIAMNGMAASDKIFKILDLPENEKGTQVLDDENTEIILKNVSFSYDGSRQILKNVSMTIAPGSFVCVVGESGCGKSTIARLLMGRKRCFDGKIMIGTKLLADLSEKELMKKITMVNHESYLFKGTVEENLKMGDKAASPEAMISALKAVNLWAFLEAQDGLLTKLSEKASNLSGGQRQRLAIARALLHDSPVYIFDEATSNIDAESEEIIMKVIKKLAETKTVLLVSHRLANVVDADKIYVLNEGYIAEEGCHKALLSQDGLYAKLFYTQQSLENYGQEVQA